MVKPARRALPEHARSRMLKISIATAAAVLGLTVPVGAAESDARSELSVRFDATAPGAPTGLSIRVLYKDPSDPHAKPPPLESASFQLPIGTRIDGDALPSCEATNEELQARGRAACPTGSWLGGGRFVAVTGFGPPVDPFVADNTLFNGGDEVIELVTFKDTEVTAGVDRLQIRGHRLEVDSAPATPGGPPDGRTVPREIAVSIPLASPTTPFLTTPPACPPSGAWVSNGVFTFTDGGVSRVSSETQCSPARERRVRLVLNLKYRAGHTVGGRRCARTDGPRGIRMKLAGRDQRLAQRATFGIAGRRVRGSRPDRLSRFFGARHRGKSHVHRVRAGVRLVDGRLVRISRRLRFCGS